MGLYYPSKVERFEYTASKIPFQAGPGQEKAFASIDFDGISSPTDIFISHKNKDVEKAKEVAEVFQRNGLSCYLDIWDYSVRDTPTLEVYLRSIIRRCLVLCIVITSATKESWWVPFEIGAAREREKHLLSFADKEEVKTLPSYLEPWPVVTSIGKLETWIVYYKGYTGIKKQNELHDIFTQNFSLLPLFTHPHHPEVYEKPYAQSEYHYPDDYRGETPVCLPICPSMT